MILNMYINKGSTVIKTKYISVRGVVYEYNKKSIKIYDR